MPIGKVEFWNPARREGALLTESNERFRFTAGALAGLDPSEVHRGLELEFEVMSGGDAGRVRKREALFMTLKEDLPVDHRCFRVVPCPDRTRTLVESMLEREGVNPGLRLDKYLVPAPRQEQQKERLGDFVTRAGGDVSLFSELAGRRRAMLQSLATRAWTRETAGSLALHLARASALENSGICLHPIHGFAYLPGTGLKGLARAFAESVWLPLQAHETARQEIDRVFGQAGHETAASGTVVFHDAWPTTWPRLIVDLVNNHHKKYYEGKDAPGDWESPEMAYFLAVDKGQEFSFALGERSEGTSARDLDLAHEWLDGGLTHLGFGAKTAAGYGRFESKNGKPATFGGTHPRFAEFEARLTLVTPAFLAGAMQQADDCDLRPATLRGLLRWWWRTMHAGSLDEKALLRLESLLWGDTKTGSLIHLATHHERGPRPDRFEYRGYLNYGMADHDRKVRLEDSTWSLRLIAKSRTQQERLTPGMVRDQAIAALWLLCHYGGIGSKGRKGYGSLELSPVPSGWSRGKVEQVAKDLRCWATEENFLVGGAAASMRSNLDWPRSPSLEGAMGPLEWPVRAGDAQSVLEAIDAAYRTAARSLPGSERLILGLPRKGQKSSLARLASPVHVHVARSGDGAWVVRALAFPSEDLKDLETSRGTLARFLEDFGNELKARESLAPRRPRTPPGPPRRSPEPQQPRSELPKVKDRVQATLLAEKTKKGGWRARHEPSGFVGPVQDSHKVPSDKQPGDVLTLVVASVNEQKKEMSFKAT